MKSLTVKLIVTLLLTISLTANAKTDTDLWRASDHSSVSIINHDLWGELLSSHVHLAESGVNLFAYTDVTAADRNKLSAYIESMAMVRIDEFNAQEQLAYWINLYNALTVSVILENYPVTSIRKIGGSFFAPGPWNQTVVSVKGQDLTLNDIEHRIIRPVFADKRIHYAVNCASIGCPNLSPAVYQGATLGEQLDAAACEFIRHPRGVQISGDKLRLSSIYKWYIEDFGDSVEALKPHLAECLDPEVAERLLQLETGFGKVKYQYDWKLNAK